MRMNKSELNKVVLNLAVDCANNKINYEALSKIAKRNIPCIEFIKGNDDSLLVRTNIIYDTHNNYIKDIKKLKINISDIKSTHIEFGIDYFKDLNKVIIDCGLWHDLGKSHKKLNLSKKDIRIN